jgi:hypothetical protein
MGIGFAPACVQDTAEVTVTIMIITAVMMITMTGVIISIVDGAKGTLKRHIN